MNTEQVILAANVVCWVVFVPAFVVTLFSIVTMFAADEPGEGRYPAKIALMAFAVVCVALFGVVATW